MRTMSSSPSGPTVEMTAPGRWRRAWTAGPPADGSATSRTKRVSCSAALATASTAATAVDGIHSAVVDDEQQRAAPAAIGDRVDDRAGGNGDPPELAVTSDVEAVRTTDVLDPAAVLDDGGGELADQTRAAAVDRTEQHAEPAGAPQRAVPRLAELGQFVDPPDERRRGAQRRREQRALAGDGQRRILIEDLALQVAQLGAGLEAELLGKRTSRPLEGAQRLLLAASGVQPLHQQGPRPLPPGILDDEPFQFGDGGRRRPVESWASARSSIAASRSSSRRTPSATANSASRNST